MFILSVESAHKLGSGGDESNKAGRFRCWLTKLRVPVSSEIYSSGYRGCDFPYLIRVRMQRCGELTELNLSLFQISAKMDCQRHWLLIFINRDDRFSGRFRALRFAA
jgi:hypothetical protein